MTDEQIIQRLREVAAASATAAEVATVLGELCEGGLRQSTLTTYFKRAFPSIPLPWKLAVTAIDGRLVM